MQLEKIPEELKARNQWVVWRLENRPGAAKPTKPPYCPQTAKLASTNDPATWATFDEAVSAIGKGFDGIGYVLTADDPYTFIDLDTYKENLSEEEVAAHKRIAEYFQTYAEISPSGAGLHLIVKGRVPEGIDRRGVGVYSSGRYMTMTGNVYRNAPILPEIEKLEVLWKDLVKDSKTQRAQSYQDTEPTQPDHEIVTLASNAVNGEKFRNLYEGKWQLDYPSQSEADFALIDMLAFYTKSHSQITRIFRASGLGQRPKAQRDNYIRNMLNRAFDNDAPPVDISKLAEQVKVQIEARQTAAQAEAQAVQEMPAKAPDRAYEALTAPVGTHLATDPYALPPGLLGQLAHYLYSTAARPVREIALCGAIGLMAGICGRAYNISGTGLNHYLMLLANTGTGKEAMAEGIARLMNEVVKRVPSAMDFIGPGQIQSEAALLKYLAKKSNCFLTIGGEFGQTLKKMASPNASHIDVGIMKIMLDVYMKSGWGSVLRPTIYSDSDKSTLEVKSPAFSFIGESAPEPFYESIDDRMITNGLLPRFTIIEYRGPRNDLNAERGAAPSEDLIHKIASICVHSLQLNSANTALPVQMEEWAKNLLDGYDLECTKKINTQGINEVSRHIWSRAHLRALKLAGLVAVGLNPYNPVITLACAQWAVNLSAHNTDSLLSRFESGEIGSNSTDDRQVKEVQRVISDYLRLDWGYISKYSKDERMHAQHIVPYVYINKRLAATSAFKYHKVGATGALNIALKVLVDNGDITEVPKQTMFNKFGTSSRAFAISDPNAFIG